MAAMAELPPNPITSPFHTHALPPPPTSKPPPLPYLWGAGDFLSGSAAFGPGDRPPSPLPSLPWGLECWLPLAGELRRRLAAGFCFCRALSVKHRSYLPYLLLPLVLGGASLLVCRFARARPVLPMAAWLRWLHYLVLVLFLVVLLVVLLRF